MSHLLELPRAQPLPSNLNSPPYVVCAIYGNDITFSLPPFIPLNLVLYFAPVLRKWVLPTPDLAYLPRSIVHQALRTPYVGLDIHAPITAAGLSWIIMHMLHLGGRTISSQTFIHPDLITSVGIHNAWVALELPLEGLRGLHSHIQAQLMVSCTPVCLQDMHMLWGTFAHDSGIVEAMGVNFAEACGSMEYNVNEAIEIIDWFRSTPDLYSFFQNLRLTVPKYEEGGFGTVTNPATKKKGKVNGVGNRRTSGQRTKAAAAKQAAGQVDTKEPGTTRKFGPYERVAESLEAFRTRLGRRRSDDSLRSVSTVVWDPQTPDATDDVEEGPVNGDMNDKSNYPGGSLSTALERSLEMIRSKREARRRNGKSSAQLSTEDLALANLELVNAMPGPSLKQTRHRRYSGSSTTANEHELSVAELEKRIQSLKEKQMKLSKGLRTGDGGNDRVFARQEDRYLRWGEGVVRSSSR